MRGRIAVAGAVAGLLLCTAAAAQEHRHQEGPSGRPAHQGMHGMMEGMAEMMPAMARVHVFSPQHLLEHREVLKLTDEQVNRLTALKATATKAHDDAQASHDAHHKQMMDALAAAAPNAREAQGHFQAAHTAMGNAHWAMIEASIQAMAVLTEVQRARVEGWADAMREQGPMMRQPGGPYRPTPEDLPRR